MQNTFLFRILASLCSLFLTVPTVCSADEEYSDSWYPRTVTSDEGTAVIHAPQIDAWTDFETLSAWQAFSSTRTGSDDT